MYSEYWNINKSKKNKMEKLTNEWKETELLSWAACGGLLRWVVVLYRNRRDKALPEQMKTLLYARTLYELPQYFIFLSPFHRFGQDSEIFTELVFIVFLCFWFSQYFFVCSFIFLKFINIFQILNISKILATCQSSWIFLNFITSFENWGHFPKFVKRNYNADNIFYFIFFKILEY